LSGREIIGRQESDLFPSFLHFIEIVNRFLLSHFKPPSPKFLVTLPHSVKNENTGQSSDQKKPLSKQRLIITGT
jgi:hypothetical protein